MARGGGNTNSLAVEPEVEAAFVESAASNEVDVQAERARLAEARAAQRASAEQYFIAKMREQIKENMEANEVDADVVDLSDKAMAYRLKGLRKIIRDHKVKANDIQREVMASGKSRLMDADGKLIAIERADGQLMELNELTAEMV